MTFTERSARLARLGIDPTPPAPRFAPPPPPVLSPIPPGAHVGQRSGLLPLPIRSAPVDLATVPPCDRPRAIVNAVARRSGITGADIIRQTRYHVYSRPRQLTMYLLRELTPMSLPAIGRVLKRDHSTVKHGINQVRKYPRRFGRLLRDVREELRLNEEAP